VSDWCKPAGCGREKRASIASSSGELAIRFDERKALVVYAGCVTLALTWCLVAPRSAKFATVDVQRINVRERDGTLRLVISNRDRFPGLILHGSERPRPDRGDAAGMIFYNDEGSENGGLIFGGRKSGGEVSNFGHLSFDQYDQDQVATLEQTEEDGQRRSGLTIADRPDAPMDLDAVDRIMRLPTAQRIAKIERLRASGTFGEKRAFFGKTEDGSSTLDLKDAKGRTRLRFSVSADGAARIAFLDASGKLVREIEQAP